jgi:hypothetical protein
MRWEMRRAVSFKAWTTFGNLSSSTYWKDLLTLSAAVIVRAVSEIGGN